MGRLLDRVLCRHRRRRCRCSAAAGSSGGGGVPWDGWLRCSVAAPEAAEFRGADWPGRAEDLTQFEFHDRPAAAWAAGFTEVTRKPT